MNTKICNTCGLEFPATTEFFNVDKSCKFGTSNRCKICSRKKATEYYALTKDKSKAYREANQEKIRKRKKEYYLKNKDKYNNLSKQNYIANKKRYIQRSQEWKKNHPEKIKEYSARRYQKIKEHHQQLTRRWKQEHKELRNVHWQNRRAMKSKVISDYSKQQWENAKNFFSNECAYCGCNAKLTQDHFIPIFVGGNHIESNIIPSCGSCNSSKSIKLFEDWYPNYKHYSLERHNRILEYLKLYK